LKLTKIDDVIKKAASIFLYVDDTVSQLITDWTAHLQTDFTRRPTLAFLAPIRTVSCEGESTIRGTATTTAYRLPRPPQTTIGIMRGLKNATMAGNISNQRYEAEHHITRHLKVVSETEATRETSRWRETLGEANLNGQDDKKLRKLHLKNLSLEHENEQLAERIHTIMTECRQDATIEYTPGWRIGKVGTVIDCYASKKNDAEKFTTMHGRSVEAERAEHKRQNFNMKLYNSIQRARSAYAVEDCMKSYEHNRHLARVLNNKVSHTTLHLGLVKAAREKEQAKRKSKARKAGATGSRPSSGTNRAAAGLATSDSAVSSFGLAGPQQQDARPSSAALAGAPADARQYAAQPRPSTTQATGARPRPHTVSYNNASSSSSKDLTAAAEIVGVKKSSQLATEARDSAANQARLQQEYPASYVYASSMGGVIERASVKPFTAPAPSSSSPKSAALFPTLLAPESLSASIAGELWETFNRIGSVGPAAVQEPAARPKTSAGTYSSGIVRMEDWGQGALNGGWEKSLVPLIRLGERASDRRETWMVDTRNVYLRRLPSEGQGQGQGRSRPGTASGIGPTPTPATAGKAYTYRNSSPKGDRRAASTPLSDNNNNNNNGTEGGAGPLRQPYCPELVNIDASGPGSVGLAGDSSISGLEGGSIDDGSVTVLPVGPAGVDSHVVIADESDTAGAAGASAVGLQSSVLRGTSSSRVSSPTLLDRYKPPSPAQVRTESRRAKKKEQGWSDDFAGKQTKFNRSTVDVSVKGGRVRIAEGLFAPI
jgi:hypothetical protein